MPRITPKNWREFQHYKDRNPPWIRLQKSLLDNYEFHCLPVASRALAPMLWLVASDSIDGHIDFDEKKIAFRLRMSVDELRSALKPLIDNGFFILDQGASSVLAECLQSAVPETETETLQKRGAPLATPDGVSVETWQAFLKVRKAKRAPMSELALAGIQREADAAGWTLEAALTECVTRGWQSFKAEWVAKQSLPVQQNPILAGAI